MISNGWWHFFAPQPSGFSQNFSHIDPGRELSVLASFHRVL
jgi:hypothetical protein